MGRNFVSVILLLCAFFIFLPGCSKSASGNSTPSITITSPSEGSRVDRDKVFVSGSFVSSSAGPGISVNDYPATIQGNKFYVYIPFRNPGENIIFAKLVDSNGDTAEKSISVYHSSEERPLTLSTNIFSGTPPLTVNFSISFSSPNPASLYQVDFDGDGKFDYSSDKRGQITWTYNSPGVFTVNATVTDNSGKAYSDQAAIVVLSVSEASSVILNKWKEFTSALREGNISAALSCLDEEIRPGYQQIFYTLANKLPEIFTQPEQMHLVYMREGTAVCNNLVNESGAKMSYPVTFVMDKNGVWKIRNF